MREVKKSTGVWDYAMRTVEKKDLNKQYKDCDVEPANRIEKEREEEWREERRWRRR